MCEDAQGWWDRVRGLYMGAGPLRSGDGWAAAETQVEPLDPHVMRWQRPERRGGCLPHRVSKGTCQG